MRLPEFTAHASLYKVVGRSVRLSSGTNLGGGSVTTQAIATGLGLGGITWNSCDPYLCYWDGSQCYCPTDLFPPRLPSF